MINRKRLISSAGNFAGNTMGIFILYILISFIVLMVYRFIFPGGTVPLDCFSLPWRFTRGVLDFIGLFPALTMSSLVIPFGFKVDMGGNFARFSPKFIEKIQGAILAAIIASACYGLLFFIALPLVQESQSNMRFKGDLFKMARERTELAAAQRNWQEASNFFAICENIWPQSPALEHLRSMVTVGAESTRFSGHEYTDRPVPGQSFVNRENRDMEPRQAVRNAAEALDMAKAALAGERYYDAHWLATLASRLARAGSFEAQEAVLTASLAWNEVSSMEPGIRETENHALYHLKRRGYEAMVSGDWIRAYYIFRELSELSPEDPDVANFLTMSEQGTAGVAFFIDEIEAGIGENLTNAVFSIPLVPAQGMLGNRVVMRTDSLFIYPDYSYAMGLEIIAFDENNRLLYKMKARYAKFIPMTVQEKPRLVILLRALSRYDEKIRWEPEWTGSGYSGLGDAQIALDVTYEHFLLLSKARRRVDSLFLADLLAMSKNFRNYGYIPQVFQAEIIRRISEPVILLPLSIFAIIIGWRFRAKIKPKFLGIPMLVIIPVIFNGVVQLIRGLINTLELWMLLSLGFFTAVTIFIVGALLFFILSLIVLASQHG
jgi:hypothetical protein